MMITSIVCSKRGKLHQYWVYSRNKYFVVKFGLLLRVGWVWAVYSLFIVDVLVDVGDGCWVEFNRGFDSLGGFFFLTFFLVGFGFSPTLGVELVDDWALC
ncbi:hypothetical protein CsSME_00013821 [Camellia sinensis var. sinensis]